jgi:hypothetical protein
MSGPADGSAGALTGVILLPSPVSGAILTLFALAAAVFGLDLLRRMRTKRHDEEELPFGAAPPPKQPWLRTLTQLLSLANFVIIAYLLWQHPMALALLTSFGGGAGAAGAVAQDSPVPAPFFVTWTFAGLALAAGGGALALALLVAFSDRLIPWWERTNDAPPPPLIDAVDDSLEDLRAEPDARRAIIRCYARFERAAAASGLERAPWQTPMEFMREALSRLPAPRAAVRALTGLFELARFSDRALGPAERDRALDALDDIKAAVDRTRADAIAS